MTMPETTFLDLLLQTAPVAFFDMLGAAALGGVFIAFACECVAAKSKKAFYDKFAQQLAAMSLWALLLATLAGAAVFAIAAGKLPGLTQWAMTRSSPALPLGASIGFTLFSAALYKANWRNLRQAKTPHLFLGTFAVLGGLAVLYTGMAAIAGLADRFLAPEAAQPSLLALLAPAGNSPFWPLLAGAFTLCLVYGGGLGAAYLVHRRSRDDYGRDYYAFALPLATRWALVPLLGVAACAGWLAAQLSPSAVQALTKHPLVCYAGTAAAVALLTALAWLPIAFSKRPMRLKGLALLAALLLWGLHTLVLFLALTLYPLA